MKNKTTFINTITFLIVILLCTSCSNNDNAPTIMGVKVAGYGWLMKWSLSNQGFTSIKEEQNAFVMEGKYNDEICYICIRTGKRGKVLLASLKILGFSLEKQFEELENECNNKYILQENYDTEYMKSRQWLHYVNNETIGQIELEGKVSSYDIGQKTPEVELENPWGSQPLKIGGKPLILKHISEIDLTVMNMENIKKYKM